MSLNSLVSEFESNTKSYDINYKIKGKGGGGGLGYVEHTMFRLTFFIVIGKILQAHKWFYILSTIKMRGNTMGGVIQWEGLHPATPYLVVWSKTL